MSSTPYNINNPDLARQIIRNPHILGRYLGYKDLTPLHSEWIKYIWRSNKHVSLQAHRGSYKTTSIIVVGSIANMMFNWNDRTAIIRKDFTSASDVVKVISRHIQSDRFQALFHGIFGIYPRIVIDSLIKLEWNLKDTKTPEGNVMPFGIGGSITGKHFDHILCDDIITIRDRLSKAERNAVDEFVREVVANVIDPGKFVKFSGTPWHKQDTWRLLPTPLVFDIYTTGLKAFTPERIEEIKKFTTRSLFAANYELKHVASDDVIFSEPTMTDVWDMTLPTYGHIDAKYQGDHTGAFTIMSPKPDGRIQAIGFIFYDHINREYANLVSKWNRYRCGTTYLELNADKGYAARDLSALGMVTKAYDETENKHVKILQNLKKAWDLIDWHEDTDPEYLSQILDYVEGQKPDDCPDSAASCIRQAGLLIDNSVGHIRAISSDSPETYRE